MTSGLCGEGGRWAGSPRDAGEPLRLDGWAGPGMLMALGCQWGRSAGRAGREAVAPCSGRLWAEPGPAPRAALLCRFPFFLLFYIFEKPTHSLKKKRTNHTVTCFTFDGTLSHLRPLWCIGRSCASGQLPVKQAGHCPVSLTPCVLRNPRREAVPADRARQLKISWPRNAECPQNLLCCF